MSDIRVGNVVWLNTPDNPYLDGAKVVVKEITSYGAKVTTGKGSGEFRALTDEMMTHPAPNGVPSAIVQAKTQGYSGDVCDNCGSMKMRRAGACLVCEDCGKSSGCG